MSHTQCRNCGDERSPIARMARLAIDRGRVTLDHVERLLHSEHADQQGEQWQITVVERLAYSGVQSLQLQLGTVMQIWQSGYCGPCWIAKYPASAVDCWAVAAGEVAPDALQEELAARGARLVERGDAVQGSADHTPGRKTP